MPPQRRKSLEERSIARAARREAAEDPSGSRKLFRFATLIHEEFPPLVALMDSGLAVRTVHGPLSVEEKAELEAHADAALQDPRTIAYLEKLRAPASENLEKSAQVAVVQQSMRSIHGSNERVKAVASQDLLNRGGYPATTVQKVETTQKDLEKLTDEELELHYQQDLDGFRQQRGKATH